MLQSPQHPEPRLSFKPWLATTHVSERWRQPGGGSGRRLSRVVPKQGSPGHTRPPAWIAHPSPAFALCLALCRSPHPMRGASSRVPPERTQVPGRPVPPDHSPGRATGAQPPARSLGLPATGGGGPQGSPRAAAAWGRDCPVAHFLFGRAPTSALAAVAPRDSSGPPPSTRRPVPRRVPTRQSTPKAHALSHASARLGGN